MPPLQEDTPGLNSQPAFNPLDYAQFLELPTHVTAVAWHEHIPFARLLVRLLRPRVFVELGVHIGDSYLAVCEAASELGLEMACYGVDTWQGDKHAGNYDDSVLRNLRAYHDPAYGHFSRLVQSTFDDAATYFADGSIDLLHIDGLHTYDAVRHDWEQWRSKVSSNGVVLFHDTNVRDNDFGVWKLWEELRASHRSFEFLHGHGLGVLVLGKGIPQPLEAFLTMAQQRPDAVRSLFFALGNRLTLQAKVATIAPLKVEMRAFDTLALARGTEVKELTAEIEKRNVETAKRNAEHEAKLNEYDTALRANIADNKTLGEQLAAVHAELAKLREDNARLTNSASMKIGRALTAPLRLFKSSSSENQGKAQ